MILLDFPLLGFYLFPTPAGRAKYYDKIAKNS
jgi:hypothetical protein